MTKMVNIPFDLLKEVLDTAESDNYIVENERACNKDDHKSSELERDKIYKLRKIAGIEE